MQNLLKKKYNAANTSWITMDTTALYLKIAVILYTNKFPCLLKTPDIFYTFSFFKLLMNGLTWSC